MILQGKFLVVRKRDKVAVLQHFRAKKTFGLYNLFLIHSSHRVVTKSFIAGILKAQNFSKDGRTPKCDYSSISEDQKIGLTGYFFRPHLLLSSPETILWSMPRNFTGEFTRKERGASRK